MTLRLTESDLDRLIAWRMAPMVHVQIEASGAAEVNRTRTPAERASEFRRLLAIVLLPFAMVAACFIVALALA